MIYDVERAQKALRAQGLDVLANALTFNFHEFAVEQTGGFCMALIMYYADDNVTVMTGEALDHYTICHYTLAAWEGGDDVDPSPLTLDTDLNREEVVALLATPFDMTTCED